VKDTSKQFASFGPTNFIVGASSDFLELGAIQETPPSRTMIKNPKPSERTVTRTPLWSVLTGFKLV
jgi:hypothetical protein